MSWPDFTFCSCLFINKKELLAVAADSLLQAYFSICCYFLICNAQRCYYFCCYHIILKYFYHYIYIYLKMRTINWINHLNHKIICHTFEIVFSFEDDVMSNVLKLDISKASRAKCVHNLLLADEERTQLLKIFSGFMFEIFLWRLGDTLIKPDCVQPYTGY